MIAEGSDLWHAAAVRGEGMSYAMPANVIAAYDYDLANAG